MAVGRSRSQHLDIAAPGRMQVDAVQIIARLFGRNGEAGTVDQALQIIRREPEFMLQGGAAHYRIIFGRQAGEREGRAARPEHHGPRSPPASSSTCAPSRSLRTIS